MGLWASIGGFFEDSHKYEKDALVTLERVRQRVRSKYGNNRDVLRPKTAEELKFHIRCVNEQGGLENHKYALARWQIFKALYSEWITDTDRPKFSPQVWKDFHH